MNEQRLTEAKHQTASGQTKRLLLVTPSLAEGGAERHLLRILPALTARFETHLATLKSGGIFESGLSPDVVLHRIGSRHWTVAAMRLRHALSTDRPAIALSFQEASNVPLLLAVRSLPRARRPATAICVQTHLPSVLAHARPRTRFLMRTAVSRLYPLADRVIAVSQGVAQDLLGLSPSLSDRTTVIYNAGVDPGAASLARAPNEHPFLQAGSAPVLVACGRLSTPKDYPMLLRAVGLIAATRQIRLVVCGDGPLHDSLVALTKAQGLSDIVDFVGYTANPYAYMARAAVFVLSSRWEGFPSVLVEALACGVPVVATACPHGPAEILEGGRYGRLVPPGDPQALADAVQGYLDRPDVAQSFSARGPSRAAEFAPERSQREYIQLLESLPTRS